MSHLLLVSVEILHAPYVMFNRLYYRNHGIQDDNEGGAFKMTSIAPRQS